LPRETQSSPDTEFLRRCDAGARRISVSTILRTVLPFRIGSHLLKRGRPSSGLPTSRAVRRGRSILTNPKCQRGFRRRSPRGRGIVPKYPIGRLTVREALSGSPRRLTRRGSEGLSRCAVRTYGDPRWRVGLVWIRAASVKAEIPPIPDLGTISRTLRVGVGLRPFPRRRPPETGGTRDILATRLAPRNPIGGPRVGPAWRVRKP
jgi:hypothetical protein